MKRERRTVIPTIGIVCPFDDTNQLFSTCIDCHIHRSRERNCAAPVQVIKAIRDNPITRKGAGVSASTIIQCPRAVAIEDTYDLYEPVISGWNKLRGTISHVLMEQDSDPPPWVVRERRVYIMYRGVRLSGKPDEIDTKYRILTDYKSKDNLPRDQDKNHELQFNFYAYMLRHGYWADDDIKAGIDIKIIGGHYLTNKTKFDKAFKKSRYRVWTDAEVESVLDERIPALVAWKTDGVVPTCNPYQSSPYWKCDCEKWETQLNERGVELWPLV